MREDRRDEDRLLDEDPVGRFLGKQLDEVGRIGPIGMRRGSRPAKGRLLLAGIVMVVLGGGVAALAVRSTGRAGPKAQATRTEAPSVPPAPVTEAVVRLVQGTQWMYRADEMHSLAKQDSVGQGDVIRTEKGGAVGLELDGGTALVLEGVGKMRIQVLDAGRLRLDLSDGNLALRVAGDRSVVVAGKGAEVTISKGVLGVRATGDRLENVVVRDGGVEVRLADGRTTVLAAGDGLDVASFSPSGDRALDTVALRLLATFVEGVEIPGTEAEQVEASDGDEAAKPVPPLSLADRIRQALDSGDLDGALALVGTIQEEQAGPDLLSLAGEVYRISGRWEQAAGSYVAAAAKGSGKGAEMALLRAAEIYLRKLDDPASACATVEDYLRRFPEGAMLDEALLQGGAGCAAAGNVDRAMELLEEHLSTFPKSPQSSRVHLMLARLLAGRKGDCASAHPHIEAVLASSPEGALAEQASALAAECGFVQKATP